MAQLVVTPAKKRLEGSVPLPSDRNIGHRAIVLAALSRGSCRLRGFSHGQGNAAMLRAFAAVGVAVEADSGDGMGSVVVHGRGLTALTAPVGPIECGHDGTTMRLLAGVLAAQPFGATLVGDASLSRRPMGRVARPLRARGASIEGVPHPSNKDEITAPLQVGPLASGARLQGLEYRMPEASSQVKSALLLSGLFAAAETTVYEPTISRDHTERMLSSLGIKIQVAGTLVRLEPPDSSRPLPEFDVELPGDLSAAAFVLCAGAVVPGSLVSTRRTSINPTRAGILEMIRAFRGAAGAEAQGEVLGEPFGVVSARYSELRATTIGGELATRGIDEIPIASVLAARARGTTEFTDVGELRAKESDRVTRIVELLRAFGLDAEEREDGFVVEGRPDAPLTAARVSSHGDHRIAMTAAVLGLVADGTTVVEDADCIAASFPRFAGTLRALGAEIEVRR
jgi:3-phosphoshikimate 1-carboxyvinyltransferase